MIATVQGYVLCAMKTFGFQSLHFVPPAYFRQSFSGNGALGNPILDP